MYQQLIPEDAASCLTIVDLLRMRAQQQPDQLIYSFLSENNTKADKITYSGLDQWARKVGKQINAAGAYNEPVLLLLPSGLNYIAALFGCMYAEAVAVPVYPPTLNRSFARLQMIAQDAQARYALTSSSIFNIVQQNFKHTPELRNLTWLIIDSQPPELADWDAPRLSAKSVALLQYTSGSTRNPRGVILTHANLLHNLAYIETCFELSTESRGLIWLPLHHDMGLIGGVLQPLFSGFPVTLFSPTAFLQRPFLWLQTIMRERATVSGGPNFAYELCLKKSTAEERSSLDLSSWTLAFVGAEPVRATMLKQFTETFAPCGFHQNAFYPCYGLAEGTLLVAAGRTTEPPVTIAVDSAALSHRQVMEVPHSSPGSQTLVGYGQQRKYVHIEIVDQAALLRVPQGQVGEIWLSSSSNASGYWNQPEETKAIFHAYLANTHEGPFLRTGDLGFLHHNELFITGRLKDTIIIRGRNYYPQDIEYIAAQSHPALRAYSCAAFSVEIDGEERLVVIQEIERQHRLINLTEAINAIRAAVALDYEIQVYAVILVMPGNVPKTSSGKVQRSACRQAFLAGNLQILQQSILNATPKELEAEQWSRETLLALPPQTAQPLLATYLQRHLATLLQCEQLDQHSPLVAQGLDSLVTIELQHNIETTFGVRISITQLLSGMTIAQLTSSILMALPSSTDPSDESDAPPQETKVRHIPLSYGQQSLWMIHQFTPDSTAYIIARAAYVLGELDVQALQQAVQSLVDRHQALRTNFYLWQGVPVQFINSHRSALLQRRELDLLQKQDLLEALQVEANRPFDLEQDLLFQVYLYHLPSNEYMLLLKAHHIIVDFWSLEILVKELGILYTALKEKRWASLPQLTYQISDYVGWQRNFLDSPVGEACWHYWHDQLATAPTTLELLTDHPRHAVQTYQGKTHMRILPVALSTELERFIQSRGLTLYTALLAVFQMLLSGYSGQKDLLIGSPVAGRSRAEWFPLVGYFVNPIVLRANLVGDPTFDAFLKQVHQKVLGALEHQDYPFALLVERLRPDRDMSRSPLFQVMFILQKEHLHSLRDLTPMALGVGGERFRLGDLLLESLSVDQSIAQFDLTLRVARMASELVLSLEYNTDLFDDTTALQLLEHFQYLLEKAIATPQQRLSTLMQGCIPPHVEIGIAANFTAEPLTESLLFWIKQFKMTSHLKFAPYNQLFQQLLDQSSMLRTNRGGINVILLSVENWMPPNHNPPELIREELVRNGREFLDALQQALQANSTPYLLCICPASEMMSDDVEIKQSVRFLEDYITSEAEAIEAGQLFVLRMRELIDIYGPELFENAETKFAADIPYTTEFFICLGTAIARKIFAFYTTPYKVIVLDCDNTLWKGQCGEDGPQGIQLHFPYLMLQRFMLQQYQMGMLLCLCSKNIEEDVFEVFHSRPEMELQLKHFVSYRINWKDKAENIKALAHELRLSLDSFILVDDDPVECAAVRARCPGVFVIQLPALHAEIPAMLERMWAFDHLKITQEDQKRNDLYLQARQREQLQQHTLTLDDFLAQLELSISIAPARIGEMERIAQLTLRTNQFNTTMTRLSSNKLRQISISGTSQIWSVYVKDRFGDYGLVGVMIATITQHMLQVDTFLLSCRALGKNIEDTMLVTLAQAARDRDCTTLEFLYTPTPRNVPVVEFFARIPLNPVMQPGGALLYTVAVAAILDWPTLEATSYGYRFVPISSKPSEDGARPLESTTSKEPAGPALAMAPGLNYAQKERLLNSIATELYTVAAIGRQIHLQNKRVRPSQGKVAFERPTSKLEETIAAIWRETLNINEVGIHDNLFDLGAHSFLAVNIQSKLQATLGRHIQLIDIFMYPTVALLAEALGKQNHEKPILEERDEKKLQTGRERLTQLNQKRQRARKEVG